MKISTLKQFCLNVMGITRWHRVSYLLCIDARDKNLTEDKKQLINRILEALKWPRAKTKCVAMPCEGRERVNQLLNQHIQKMGIEKVLIFGKNFQSQIETAHHAIPIVMVPSLNELIKDKAAKKQAWVEMQSFLNT